MRERLLEATSGGDDDDVRLAPKDVQVLIEDLERSSSLGVGGARLWDEGVVVICKPETMNNINE